MQFSLKKSTLIITALLLAFPAHAVRLVNLAGKPSDIKLTIAGQEQTIRLESNANWETRKYPVYALIGGHRLKLDPNTEYAYWPDGTLSPQHRQPMDMGH